MNPYLIFIIFILIGTYLLDNIIEWLNLKHITTTVPDEFRGFYDAEKYKKAQEYLKENTNFGFVSHTIQLPVTLTFLLLGGFNIVDQWARHFHKSEIVTGIIFIAAITLLSQLLSLPFSLYHTFVIEEKFGFNKTTLKTFFADLLKGIVLSAVIGVPIIAAILWFFTASGHLAWLYSWIALSIIQIILMFLAPAVIMPLFNKFTPLTNGELKTEIENFAKKENFKLSGIFTMDGSKRSTKANAYFTGFGKFRRIVLFDTLIQKHTTNELVAVLAHEIGHYKKKHTLKFLFLSILSTGIMFYIFSLFINNANLFAAFQMQNLSVYASLFFIGFLYAPIAKVFSLFTMALSRKYEFEADAYAAATYGHPETLAIALKKLSVENLSNLTPHPLKVLFDYSHPPVIERIKALHAL